MSEAEVKYLVQEWWAFTLTDHGRTDYSDSSADPMVVQSRGNFKGIVIVRQVKTDKLAFLTIRICWFQSMQQLINPWEQLRLNTCKYACCLRIFCCVIGFWSTLYLLVYIVCWWPFQIVSTHIRPDRHRPELDSNWHIYGNWNILNASKNATFTI